MQDAVRLTWDYYAFENLKKRFQTLKSNTIFDIKDQDESDPQRNIKNHNWGLQAHFKTYTYVGERFHCNWKVCPVFVVILMYSSVETF